MKVRKLVETKQHTGERMRCVWPWSSRGTDINLALLSQRAAFAHFSELYDFALSNVAEVDARDSLVKFFGPLR